MIETHLNIAIDGPAGAGKSTAAKLLAKDLGIRYLDTGAMYRAMALHAQRNAIDPADPEGMASIMETADIRVRYREDGSQRVLLRGEDVTDLLRTQELGMGASKAGLHSAVRDKLTELQRQVGREYDVVMDGRDITTNVLKDSPHKFYLTASVEERARRRIGELREKGGAVKTLEEVCREIELRDKNDMERDYMPLRIADDAIVIDTTDMTIDEVVNALKKAVLEED